MAFAYSPGCKCCGGTAPGTVTVPNCLCPTAPAAPTLAFTMPSSCSTPINATIFQGGVLTYAATVADAPATLPPSFRLSNQWYSGVLTFTAPPIGDFSAIYNLRCVNARFSLAYYYKYGEASGWAGPDCIFLFNSPGQVACSPFLIATNYAAPPTGAEFNGCYGFSSGFYGCGGRATIS